MSGNKSTNLNCKFSKSASISVAVPFGTEGGEILRKISKFSPVVQSPDVSLPLHKEGRVSHVQIVDRSARTGAGFSVVCIGRLILLLVHKHRLLPYNLALCSDLRTVTAVLGCIRTASLLLPPTFG